MNKISRRDRSSKEQRQRERADEAVHGSVLWLLGMVVLALLAGCGSSSEQVASWNVGTNSSNALVRSRAWELCGGTITCTYRFEAPANKDAVGGFVGSATADQAACYQQYSGSNNVAEAPGMCQ